MRVTVTVDGQELALREGQDLLSACLTHGHEIPYFCWHGAMGSIGACRLCAVRVHDGPGDDRGRIAMACMTPVTAGQRVAIADPEAQALRAAVIEWLMVNHPHDCPVCEEGGSCHLQDMTVATGHRTRRFRFEKRTHRNQDLGPLLTHEMNRCIACWRCTRFYRDYAGGRDLDAFGAHDRLYFGRAEDGPLESPFAGNLAEVCPTGVFNDRGWSSAYARKWDMRASPSVCPHCAVGCNLLVAERDGQVRRVQNRFHGAINGWFLCDRGRFGALHVASPARLREPRVEGRPVGDATAIEAARAALAAGALGIASPRGSLESAWALRQLVGAERFVAATSDAEARLVRRIVEILRAGPGRIVSRQALEQADAVLVLGEDLTGTAPRLALALRQTARGAERALAAAKGVPAFLDQAVRTAGEGRRSPILLVTPGPDALDGIATRSLRLDPEAIAVLGHAVARALRGETTTAEAAELASVLAAAHRPVVIAGAASGAPAVVEAAAAIAQALGERGGLVLVPPEANSMGLALLADAGLEHACALLESGTARALLVVEADLFERAPSPLVERVLDAAQRIVVLDCLETRTTARADVVLPVAAFTEAAGTFVNHEGRAQRLVAAIESGPPAAWRRLAVLGAGGWTTLDELLADLARLRPDLAGVRDAAPPASFRTTSGRIARTPRPFSGHTADDRAGRVPEAVPPEDPDSALAWGMEGARGLGLPAALLTAYTTPGLSSANAVTRFLEEIEGPLRGGDPGALLLTPGDGSAASVAGTETITAEGLLLVPLHDPFTGTETARASPLLAARAPAPRLVLHPQDAAALGLVDGDAVTLDGRPCAVPISLDPGLARGVLGASVGTLAPRGALRRVRVERAR